jgi:ribose transport system permease protein
MPTALMWAGVGLLAAVAWQLLGAMHATGRQVEGGMLARSAMGTVGSLGLGLLVCLVVGAFCGWLNGTMIVGLKVHPFIITLGTMAAYRGVTALPTQAQSVGNFPESFQGFIKQDFSGITPVPVLIMMVVCLAGVFVLSRTVLGRQIYAIGGNETAASYAGIPVGKVKRIVYTMMGALAGLSAYVYLGYFGGAEPAAGTGYELKAIAAAVIGGASLSGGRGSALGAVLGAILVQLIDNAMVMLQIDQSYNNVVLGGAIIVAVVLDQLKSRLVPVGK